MNDTTTAGPLTAFAILIDSEGAPSLVLDLPEEMVAVQRKATLRDVRRALLDISADLAAQAAAQYVVAANVPEAPSEKVAKAVAKRRSSKKES